MGLKEKKDTPGPGAYNLRGKIEEKGKTMGGKRREKEKEKMMAGPGSYELDGWKKKKGFSLGREERGKEREKEEERGPGPNEYHLVTRPGSASYSMARG